MSLTERLVHVPAGDVTLEGNLTIPDNAAGVVVFAHGSGSSRHSSRNQFVARQLQSGRLATLLIDLLSSAEEEEDLITRELRFDIGLLANRLGAALDWLEAQGETRRLRAGLFGASTGGGAALVAAARNPERVGAIVSRGGRPDLAGDALPHVRAPTLLLVGSHDEPVIGMNERAMAQMRCEVRLEIVPGASHLFEEPGTLDRVSDSASDWFGRHL